MATLSVRLPDSYHKQLKSLAAREGVSINQLVASAVGEKLSALLTEEYLAERGGRGKRAAFERVLDRAGDAEPEPTDRIKRSRPKAARRG